MDSGRIGRGSGARNCEGAQGRVCRALSRAGRCVFEANEVLVAWMTSGKWVGRLRWRRVEGLVGLLVLIGAIHSALAEEQEIEGRLMVVRAARLFDGKGATVLEDAAIMIRGERIVEVGAFSKVTLPKDATILDLGDATLLPGFIDAHVHLIGRVTGDPKFDDSVARDFPGYAAILGTANARATLNAGFTTVRNVGAPEFYDIALRDAINEGIVPGPRMQAAGIALGITGGHCDENGFKPGLLRWTWRDGIADGVDEVRKAVRYQVKSGADVIKICATGGVLSDGDSVALSEYSDDELAAIVDEARRRGRKVAAHAHGGDGIVAAAKAGVASVEHGTFLTAEGAKLMAKDAIFLVPTLQAFQVVKTLVDSGKLTGQRGKKAMIAFQAGAGRIKMAREFGVPIALGTDAGVGAHGKNAEEFSLMVDAGLTTTEALIAGTSNAARLLGWDSDVGELTAGHYADVVAVRGNPLLDISVTRNPIMVMKGGVLYVRPSSR